MRVKPRIINVHASYVQSPNSQKTIRPRDEVIMSNEKTIRPRDEVIMSNDDETYDEIMMKLG